MRDLGLALALEFPDKINGVDYEVRDDGKGPFIAFWHLPGEPPQSQAQVDAILRKHDATIVEREASRDPDWPTFEERLEDVEQALVRQGQSLPSRGRMEQARARARQKIGND